VAIAQVAIARAVTASSVLASSVMAQAMMAQAMIAGQVWPEGGARHRVPFSQAVRSRAQAVHPRA
jgi:hypothetical protein